jgi:hypothetical protein
VVGAEENMGMVIAETAWGHHGGRFMAMAVVVVMIMVMIVVFVAAHLR